jgi:hypothetical protein
VTAAIHFGVTLAIADRKIIALNINNGILARMAWEFIGLAIGFAVFGLLCGFCYWMMLVRAARAGNGRCGLIDFQLPAHSELEAADKVLGLKNSEPVRGAFAKRFGGERLLVSRR